MADITLSIPDAKLAQAVNNAALALNYQSKIPAPNGNSMVPNPESRKAFVIRSLSAYLKGLIREGARKAATETAVATADASVSDISVT